MLIKKTIFYLFLSIIMLPSVCFGWDTHFGVISVNDLEKQTKDLMSHGKFESNTFLRTHPYLVYKAVKLLERKDRLPYFLMDNSYLIEVLVGSVMEDFDIKGGYDVKENEVDFYNRLTYSNLLIPADIDEFIKDGEIIRFSRAFNHYYTGDFDPEEPSKGAYNEAGKVWGPILSSINNAIYWGLYNTQNLRGIGAINPNTTSFSDLLLILGHVSHLLGDMSVPYHVYGVGHPWGVPRYGGNPLTNIEHWLSEFSFQKHDDIGEGGIPLNLDNIDIPEDKTIESLFENLSLFTRNNYFCAKNIFTDSQKSSFNERIIDYSRFRTMVNYEKLTIDSTKLSDPVFTKPVSPRESASERLGLEDDRNKPYVVIKDNELPNGDRYLARVIGNYVDEFERTCKGENAPKKVIGDDLEHLAIKRGCSWEEAKKMSYMYTTEAYKDGMNDYLGGDIINKQSWSLLRNRAIGYIARLIELYNDKYINFNTTVKTNFEKWTEIKVGDEKMGFRLKTDGIITYNDKIFKVALGFTTSDGVRYDKVVVPEKIFVSPISPTKRFVFIRADNYDNLFINLFLLDVINGKLTEVPTGKYGNDYYVMWSPDEKHAITHSENEEYTLLYRIDLNTGDTRVVDVNYLGREKNRINYYPRRSGTHELISSKNIIWKSNNRLNAIVNIKCCAMCWPPPSESCDNYDYDFVLRSYSIEVDFSKYDDHGNVIDIKTHLNPSPGPTVNNAKLYEQTELISPVIVPEKGVDATKEKVSDKSPIGTWSGTVNQFNTGDYPVRMTLINGNNDVMSGSINYKSLNCGGNLKLIRSGNSIYVFRENITYGRGRCIDGGTIEVNVKNDGNLDWKWFRPGGEILVVGALKKEY